MVCKLDKTPEMNNPKTNILTNNRFNTYLVLIFNELNKAQIYKMPYRDSPHPEIEIIMTFDYLKVFKPKEHKEDYLIRIPNDGNLLFEIGDKIFFYVGEKVTTFETNDIFVKNLSELGFNDIKIPYAYGENNVYFLLHRKYIPIQEYESSTLENEYEYLY